MRELHPGTQLANRYNLVRKLGAGGGTETWLATDRLTRASVALKVAAKEGTTAEVLRSEWQRSIRLMHAHIVRVFEFHDDADGAFYSLQHIDGPDISVLSGAALGDILPPIALIADALRYAHGKDVVHRDIKTSNVLLDHNGAPYLIDFGVAAKRGSQATGGSLIAASPEALDGLAVTTASDIFALGGMIFELISGRSPYSSAATAEDIRDKQPAALTAQSGEEIPESIRGLVSSMLEKNPANRPDAETVAAEIGAAGFAPGPAPSQVTGQTTAIRDEVIESRSAKHEAFQRADLKSQPAISEAKPGLSPRTLGISLGVALLVLLLVVFYLPSTVTIDTEPETAVQSAGDRPAADDTAEDPKGPAFSENIEDLSGRDERVQARAQTEDILGELLSKMSTLEARAVQRWGGLAFKRAEDVYAEGDAAYIEKDYQTASAKYREAISIVDPLLAEVDIVYRRELELAEAALEVGDTIEALERFELAVAMSPSDTRAQSGLRRARNLDEVLALTDQGLLLEKELELESAQRNFARAVELDSEWQPAKDGLARVLESINQRDFDQRMTEGLIALSEGGFEAARAAFRMAQSLKPGSPEPADGMLQVEQGIRLGEIGILEQRALSQEDSEQWQEAADTYGRILELDGNLHFAQVGKTRAEQMTALHQRLDDYLEKPDSLSASSTMQAATRLVVDITRMENIGKRLAGQRDELARLLKRAATPLRVQLISDNVTDVSIYKVGKLGSFDSTELDLRPGTYVAVGIRPGFRDVRLEFKVAPEVDMQPVVVRCEEQI